MKKVLATLVTAVVIGAGGVTVASATTSMTAKPVGSTVKSAVGAGMRKLGFETAAKTIGISTTDLRHDMKGGHSVADVATAHSVEPQKVIDAIVSTLDARIQQAVTNGKITSAQGTALEKIVATRTPKLVNATPKQLRKHKAVKGATTVSAKTIGVTPEALRQALVSGQSVSQVATAHGVDPKTVVAALVTAGDARIDKAVAAHHLSATRGAAMKARLPKAAQRFVDHVRSAASTPAAAA